MVSEPVRASSSAQQTNQQSQIIFSFNTPIKLDRSNYLLWRFQVLASIRGNRLEGFINGTKPAPEEQFTQVGADGSIQKIDNLEYQNWRSQDQTLLGWMLSSISEGYRDIATFITGSKMDYDDAYALLLTHETRLEQEQNDKSMFNANYAYTNAYYPRAFYAQSRNNFRRGGYAGAQFGYDNYDNHPASETSCYSGIDNYAPAEAYVANFESFADDGWYLDSGATHHLTNNMENLHFKEDYKGTDQLIIGNGQGLSISHIGHAFLSFRASKHPYTHASTIALKDMLLVPTITKNLLSISKLTSDNSLSVEFCGNVCYVKDMKGQVLLQGLAEKGQVHILRHVVFYESVFPYTTFYVPSSSENVVNSETPVSNFSKQQVYHLSTLPLFNNSFEDTFSAGVPSDEQTPVLPEHTDNLNQQESSSYSLSEPSISQVIPQIHESTQTQPEPQTSNQQHSEYNPNRIQISQPTHKMITRSKSGIFKPKLYTSTLINKEPDTIQEALNDKNWVKQNSDGSIAKYKARLVAKGFQQTEGIDYFETFSPVIKASTVRVILSLAAMQNWMIRQVDVNNAFLNGDLTEDVYIGQPEGFVDEKKSGYVCKLKKALYSLKQAPRAWFDKLKGCLVANWGFQNSRADTSLFFKGKQDSMILVLIYVDDILITGPNSDELEKFISNFSKVFALKDLGRLSYFLGIEVSYAENNIYLSQRKYVRDLLSKADMLHCKGCDTLMVTGTKLQKEAKGSLGQHVEDATSYRSLIGGLQYLVLTRPEIAFAVNKLSQYDSAPTLQHILACKRMLRYLKEIEDYGLKFSADGEIKLTGFTDADWACDIDDRKSTGAYCIYLGNNLISWSSKKQSIVTRSSAESEYRALASASAEITWLQSLFKELKIECISVPTIWCDNISATELAKNHVYHSRTKHIELDMHFIRDKVLARELEINYIPSEEQIADILNKPLTFTQFNYLRSKLNVQPCPLSLRGAVKEAH
ncbi:retrovirus-related pol polyprotein from transposon RE1 [Citrus sinensis]|uniref:Retrovirus-related pol polyprotein from transposon RE1 n=1 Tax=Citrus sinensis TaxID=2711 RepID=A0ACB8L6X3_CITSI|nr:retrovirus-related pol polyprotein from transposon RE1 [Citrus sinensis]